MTLSRSRPGRTAPCAILPFQSSAKRLILTAWSPPKPPPKRRAPGVGRPLHDDEAGALKVLDKPFGDDLGHDLVGVVDELAPLESQRESKRVSEVGWVGGGELSVGHADRIEHNRNERQVADRRAAALFSVESVSNLRGARLYRPERALQEDVSGMF